MSTSPDPNQYRPKETTHGYIYATCTRPLNPNILRNPAPIADRRKLEKIFEFRKSDEDWDGDNLFYIAEMIEERGVDDVGPDRRMGLTVNELDQIVNYEIPVEGEWPPLPSRTSDPGKHYGFGPTEIEDFLICLQWWINVAFWVKGASDLKLADIFTAYGVALDSDDGHDAFKVRLYRLYTRQICEAAKKAWPKANLEALLRLV